MKTYDIIKSVISVFLLAIGSYGLEIKSTTTVVDQIEPGTDTKFSTWYYPNGYVKVITIDALGREISSKQVPNGPQFKTIGNNAGYQLKIYSKQDPRSELLDKPILFTEGFDPAYNMEGRNTFQKMENICETVYDLNGNPTSEDGLLKILYNEDYDVVMMRFLNPNTNIYTNANIVTEVMKWIEARSAHVDGNELAVIGPSMGGLVCRTALQYAGLNAGSPTYGRADQLHVRLFIAFDSPNRGANVPLSSQGFIEFFSSENADAAGMYNNLTSHAAKDKATIFL